MDGGRELLGLARAGGAESIAVVGTAKNVGKTVTVGATFDSPFGNDNGLVVCRGEAGEPVEIFGVSQVFVEDSL